MTTDTERLLTVLLDAKVEFVVIGGIAALAHGAITPTFDLDIAAPLTEPNIERILHAVLPFSPHHATRPDLGVIWQSPAELTRFRLLLLQTDIGRLDVLGQVEPLGHFSDLETVALELVPGRQVRVLSLEQLIEVKAHLRRPKDKIVERELRTIRDRSHGNIDEP